MAFSRTDKPSPHSSPRLSRRSTGSSSVGSGGSETNTSPLMTSTSTTTNITYQCSTGSSSLHNLNGNNAGPTINNQSTVINHNNNNNLQKSEPQNKTTSSQSQQTQINLNRMSAPLTPSSGLCITSTSTSLSSSNAMSKVLSKAYSAESERGGLQQDPTAPPLPPRKSSPGIDNLSRFLKPHIIAQQQSSQIQHQQQSPHSTAISANNILITTTNTTTPTIVSSASSLMNLTNTLNLSNATTALQPTTNVISRSTENITCCDFEVPKSNPPPIPKHQNQKIVSIIELETVVDDVRRSSLSGRCGGGSDDVIVGPAKTISGIIDTRPLEARKPIIVAISQDAKDTADRNNSNNVYQFKTGNGNGNGNQQNHIRHQSYPMNTNNQRSQTPTPTKSVTTPHFGQDLNLTSSSNQSTQRNSIGSINCGGPGASGQPLLYENVTLASKDCNVPYENINLEYIARLMNEGYSKENVITALGISRNNIEMACDILHEFVSKNGP